MKTITCRYCAIECYYPYTSLLTLGDLTSPVKPQASSLKINCHRKSVKGKNLKKIGGKIPIGAGD
jgi:hypothetical protein